MNYADWQEELTYCFNLVNRGGDDNVGRSLQSIYSYVSMQSAAARRDCYYRVADEIEGLADHMKKRAREHGITLKQHQTVNGVCQLCDAGDPTSVIKLSDPCEG
jgi:hypothetical protein